MKKKLSAALAILMTITMLPISTYAATIDFDLSNSSCDFYNIIEKTDYALAPGATETEIVINDDTASNRNVIHAIEVDLKNPNISVMPTYKGISDDVDYTDSSTWGTQEMSKQAAHVEENLGLNVVGGMNVSLSWSFTHPYGLLVYNGKVLYDDRANSPGGGYLAILNDGTAELREAKAPLEGNEIHTQTICFSWLVKDGENKYSKEDHTSSAAPRSVIGVKADGTLVLMMNDGRQAPFSKGMTNHEMAETMIALGCVDAINCDGGGSSTFLSEREGTGELTMKSSPSDGAERPTLTGILVISNATADGKFDHASVEVEDDYVTPGSTVKISAIGADSAGGPADIPEDISWQLKDSSMGTVKDGEFISNGTTGEAVVQMVYNGEVVGEDTINVVIPDTIEFTQTNITVPYGKTVTLGVTAKYGFSDVVLKDGDIVFQLADTSIGTLEDNKFTATEDVSIAGSDVTAILTHNTNVVATAAITLGKGSEIVYDFESGADSIKNFKIAPWKAAYDFEDDYFPNYISVVTAEEGKVRNGNYAMKWDANFNSTTLYNWAAASLTGLNINLVDAVSLSFWIYIPEGSHGLELDIGNAIPIGLGHEFVYGTGWQYVTVPVSKIGSNVKSLDKIVLYASDTNNNGNSYKAAEHPNYYTDVVYYIDDITVNYSAAVEDNDMPTFKDAMVSYSGVDEAVSMEGQTITESVVSVSANATDDTDKGNASGLDTSSAVVYVDGVKVNSTCTSKGKIATGDIELANGTHTIRFEISDARGNVAYIERQIVINAENNSKNTIKYVPADSSLTKIPLGSVIWMNLEATAIEKVKTVTTTVDLDNNSVWQLDNMKVANGFTADYTIDEETNDATITFTRTGENESIGNTVLASLPIRTWECDYELGSKSVALYKIVSVMSHIEMGKLECEDGSISMFGSEEYVTSTELDTWRLAQTDNSKQLQWHIHNAVAVPDLEPTCTEEGYTGRTVCAGCLCSEKITEGGYGCTHEDGCGSVVDWGTTIPAVGHTYKIVDGKIACECGKVKNATGLITMDDNIYYAINGKLSSGWLVEKDNYYYFDPQTYAAKRGGIYRIDNYDYTFDADGILTAGQWVRVISDGQFKMKYMYAGKFVWFKFFTIDGKEYWFDKDGFMATGTQIIKPSTSLEYVYVIGDDGVVQGRMPDGIQEFEGKNYYFKDGEFQRVGVFELDGKVYYADLATAEIKTGKVYVSSEAANELVATGWNYFSESGELCDNEFMTVDGKTYYIVDGQIAKLGVFQYENNIYYSQVDSGEIASGKTYVIASATNDLIQSGWNYFDEDGRLYDEEFVELDGKKYYMTNGRMAKLGVFEYDDHIYYALEDSGEVVSGKVYVPASATNNLVEAGWNYFDENGKLYDNEFLEIDGKTYYMVNGRIAKLGVFEHEGNLYYSTSDGGDIKTGKTYVIAADTNDLVKAGWNYFDENGKLYDKEFLEIDGKTYYMVNGRIAKLGVFEHEGDLYYALSDGGEIKTGKTYVIAADTNDLVKAGWNYFDENGKLYDKEFLEIDGKTYYMVNGRVSKAGVFEHEGNLYYALSDGGEIKTGKTYVIAADTNDLVKSGWNYFDENGKLYDKEFLEIDGKTYYMVNGRIAKLGIFEHEGSLYYSLSDGGAMVSGRTYVIAADTNDLVKSGWNYFDEAGRLYDKEFVEIDEKTYYMVSGQIVKGVFEHEGALYLSNPDTGVISEGKTYLVKESTNGMVNAGWHYCDASGRLYNKEFVELDGKLYYMVNGEIAKSGVFELDGDLYYADIWSGEIARNTTAYITVSATNNLIIYGTHEFDSTGKMIK